MYTIINAHPKNKPIKKNPIDKTQIGRKILKSNGQSEIKVRFELDKVNIEKEVINTQIQNIIYVSNITSTFAGSGLTPDPSVWTREVVYEADSAENYEQLVVSSSFTENTFNDIVTKQKGEVNLNVDFSKFENHVFFDSAVSKVHYAYRKILNEFPYDKTEYDTNQYFLSLDGFTKYIYDNHIPKNLGYLKFDGSNEVFIKDKNGNLFNDFKGEIKTGLFNINRNKFSFDFWLYIDNQADSNAFGTQIIFQKKDSSNNGITLYADSFIDDGSIKYCNLNLIISNNAHQHLYSWSPSNLGNILSVIGFKFLESKPFLYKWFQHRYFLKKFKRYSKFLFLFFILSFNFFNCSKAKAAEISEGKKLYPASEKTYLAS